MKKLGKLMLFAGAMVLLTNFTACKPNGDDPVVIVEDGFYLAGTATGSDNLNVNYRMAAGVNEANENEKRDGMYEKYVALEAGKEFYLILKEGTKETRYGAKLANKELTGDNDQPGTVEAPFILQKGSLETGTTATAMKVNKNGLYHIILDLNKDKALDLVGGAQILIAPVEWGTRGINGDWGWNKFDAPTFNTTTMTYKATFPTTNEGDFKFAYGGGWKIQLDDAGKIKANTNLGIDAAPGAKNIALGKGTNVTITLTWKLASGDVAKSYAVDLKADKWEYTDYTKAVFSLIGSAFNNAEGTPANWDYDIDLAYNTSKSTVTDATKFYGTFVYEKAGVQLLAGGEFKVRMNHDWGVNFGYDAAKIKGNDVANFTDNGGNIKVGAAGTYDVSLKYTTPAKAWELTLTKK